MMKQAAAVDTSRARVAKYGDSYEFLRVRVQRPGGGAGFREWRRVSRQGAYGVS